MNILLDQSDTRRDNNNNNMPIDSDFPKNHEVIGKLEREPIRSRKPEAEQ